MERLGVHERDNLKHSFQRKLGEAALLKPFPVSKLAFADWAKNLHDPELFGYWEKLREHNPKWVNKAAYQYVFDVEDVLDLPCYRVQVNEWSIGLDRVPDIPGELTVDHPDHTAIISWCEWKLAMAEEITIAKTVARRAIDYCTSPGQLFRVFPEETHHLLPGYAKQYMRNAQRRSRIPKHFTPPSVDDAEVFLNTLTKASLVSDSHREAAYSINVAKGK